MSVSEQEAKQQIAQMRQALTTMKAAARRASYVRIVGVILGFGIVGIYVYLFISLGASVMHSNKFRPLVEERIRMLDIQGKVTEVAQRAFPTYMEAGQKMLATMDMTPVEKEAGLLRDDLRPIILGEVDRVWPKLQDALIVQANQGAEQLETNLQAALDTRIQAIVKKHTQQIETKTGLTEEKTAQVVNNITDAGQQAMLSMVQKRWGENQKKMETIADLVDQLPPLPTMTESELLDGMRDTLIALVKYKLPDYDVESELGQTSVKPTAPLPPAAAARSALEAAKSRVAGIETALKKPNLPDDVRKQMEQQLEAAKKQLDALQSQPQPAAAPMAPPKAGPAPAGIAAVQGLKSKIAGIETALKNTGLPDDVRKQMQQQLDEAKKQLDALQSQPQPGAAPAAAPAAANAPSAIDIAKMKIASLEEALKKPDLADDMRQRIQAELDATRKQLDELQAKQ